MISYQASEAISAYVKQCELNLHDEQKNTFFNLKVHVQTQTQMQTRMAAAGFHEFLQPKSLWPSLFISTDHYKLNPYYQHVPLQSHEKCGVAATKMRFESHRLFNANGIIDDPLRALNDSMQLRALDKPLDTRILMKDNEVWMMNTPSESNTIDPIAAKVHGRVLTFGLGIGYFVYMAMLNPHVTAIDVVEVDLNVITYFNAVIRPYLPQTCALTIHHGDAEVWMRQHAHAFDHVFVDTYQNENDGMLWWLKGCELLTQPYDHTHYWIEDSISQRMRIAMFACLVNHNPKRYDKLTRQCITKVRAYYRHRPITFVQVSEIQAWLYDHRLYRLLAATPL